MFSMKTSTFGMPTLACLILSCLLLTGCGGEATYKVDGKIEFADGSPVKFGSIEFLNRDRKTEDGGKINARGKINRDGTFSLTTFKPNDGAVAGKHAVTIQQFITVPLVENQTFNVQHDHGTLVHEKYRSYSTSDIPDVNIEASSPNKITIVVEPAKSQ